MQKALLTVILAVLVVFAAIGVKQALSPAGPASNGTVLIADGGDPIPPIPNN